VQKASEAKKHKERRKLTLAVKNHRKGMKDQLEAILNKKFHDQIDNERVSQLVEGIDCRKIILLFKESGPRNKMHGKRKISRTARDKKFGYGGPKRRSKTNDKNSFESIGKSKRSPGGKSKGGKRGKGR
jgi:rRNA-processing protein EBP2